MTEEIAFPKSGWIIINKPKGINSTKVVSIARRAIGMKKVGHAGTLDPLAEGVLPLAFGQGTRTIPYAMDATKTYEFTVEFGKATDTEDAEGAVIETSDVIPTQAEIERVLPQFTGKISQIPPAYSAIKVDGKRAYDLARQGKVVELKAREVTILSLELLQFNGNEATLRADCSKGTYIRSLARDLAKATGSCGYVTMLKRTRVGAFSIEDTISLEMLEEIRHNAPPFDGVKLIEAALDDILVHTIDLDQVAEIRFGRRLNVEDTSLAEGELALYCDHKLIAIAEHQQGEIRPIRVFND